MERLSIWRQRRGRSRRMFRRRNIIKHSGIAFTETWYKFKQNATLSIRFHVLRRFEYVAVIASPVTPTHFIRAYKVYNEECKLRGGIFNV